MANNKKRLTENHPLYKKVDAFMAFLEENNLHIELRCHGGASVIVKDTGTGVEAELMDLEANGEYPSMCAFPAACEWKLILEE